MENNNFSSPIAQGQGDTNVNQLNAPQQWEAMTSSQDAQQQTYTNVIPPRSGVPHFKLIFAVQCVAFIISLGVGIFLQFISPEMEAARLSQEATTLDEQITKATKDTDESFSKSGFDESFYQSATEQANLSEQKSSLLTESETVTNKSVIETGAIYCFVAAFLILISAIILAIVNKSRSSLEK